MIMTEIEVLNPKGESVEVYFPKAPQCYMLSEQAKKAYRDECEITDSNTKMLALMRNFKMFRILMDSDLQTWRSLGFLFKGLSSDAFKGYTFFCWLFGVVINVIMAGSIVMDSEGKSFVYRTSKHELVLRVLSYILVGISTLFLVVWMIFKYKQTYLTRFEDYLFDHPGLSRDNLRVKFRVALISSFIQQAFPMNYTLHIIFTILGMELTIFAMALNLLLIVNISKTTKFVLTSITLHWDQLVQTLILAFFVIYAYSMVLGSTLREQINPDLNAPCATLIECFFFTINLGLRNGGGVAESLSDVKKDLKFGVRSVFDVTFFMLINVISLNIIFGIIIDTFSQLRDDQNERGKLDSRSARHQKQLLRLRQHTHRVQQARKKLRRPHLHGARPLELRLLHSLPEEERRKRTERPGVLCMDADHQQQDRLGAHRKHQVHRVRQRRAAQAAR